MFCPKKRLLRPVGIWDIRYLFCSSKLEGAGSLCGIVGANIQRHARCVCNTTRSIGARVRLRYGWNLSQIRLRISGVTGFSLVSISLVVQERNLSVQLFRICAGSLIVCLTVACALVVEVASRRRANCAGLVRCLEVGQVVARVSATGNLLPQSGQL